jgi:hypothetical protein
MLLLNGPAATLYWNLLTVNSVALAVDRTGGELVPVDPGSLVGHPKPL